MFNGNSLNVLLTFSISLELQLSKWKTPEKFGNIDDVFSRSY